MTVYINIAENNLWHIVPLSVSAVTFYPYYYYHLHRRNFPRTTIRPEENRILSTNFWKKIIVYPIKLAFKKKVKLPFKKKV